MKEQAASLCRVRAEGRTLVIGVGPAWTGGGLGDESVKLT